MSRTKYDIIMLYAFLVSLFIVQAKRRCRFRHDAKE